MINLPNLSENKQILVYSILAIVISLLLYQGIFQTYAFTDANEFLYNAHNSPDFIGTFVRGGRFIYGELNLLIFGNLVDTVAQLKWIRLFSLLSCVVFSIQIFRFLLIQKFKSFESALFSLLVLSLPSFSIYMSWSVTYEISIALNLSFFAGVLLSKSMEKKAYRILKYASAVILVVISLSLYQSVGTAFLIPFVILFTQNKNKSIKPLIQLGIFFVTTFGLYYLVFKLSLVYYQMKPLDRAGIDLSNLPVKLLNFYFKEMKTLLYGSAILIQSFILLSAGTILLLGYFIVLANDKTKAFPVVFLVLVLPLSYLPNLLSVDDFICSRTLGPAAVIVLFYQFYFLRQISSNNNLFKVISIGLFIFLMSTGSFNLNIYFTGIQAKEYDAIKKELNSLTFNKNEKVILIRPDHGLLQTSGYYKYAYSDEFGQLSSSRNWVPIPFLQQLLKEKNASIIPTIETYGAYENFEVTDSNTSVIYLSKIITDALDKETKN